MEVCRRGVKVCNILASERVASDKMCEYAGEFGLIKYEFKNDYS
jgi:hypothetical protein